MNNQLTSPLLSSTKLRSSELDFVKGVLITLMVLFHLSYFVERHVALTEWVYTFHMSGFLVISGLLFNVEKDWHGFGRHCGALSFLMWCLRWCIWWRLRFPWWVYCAEFIVLPPPQLLKGITFLGKIRCASCCFLRFSRYVPSCMYVFLLLMFRVCCGRWSARY